MTDILKIINKQREIRSICDSLGWSIAHFASKYLIDTSNLDVDEDEIERFQEAVKKQLTRTSFSRRKLIKLDSYLDFLKKTEEFERLDANDKNVHVALSGFIQDYSLILADEHDSEKKCVLEVAAAHALSIGSAWSFNVVKYCDDEFAKKFIVIWEGDVGHFGGSGTWGPVLAEVTEGSFGQLFVEYTDKHFETGLRCIDEVEGFVDGVLIVTGYKYHQDDSNNFPTLKYRVSLEKSQVNKWEITSEEFISRCSFEFNEEDIFSGDINTLLSDFLGKEL